MTGNYEEFGDSVRKKDFFFNWESLKFEDLLNYNILGTEQDRVTHDRVWYDPNAWHVRGHGHGFGSDPKTGPGKREGRKRRRTSFAAKLRPSFQERQAL